MRYSLLATLLVVTGASATLAQEPVAPTPGFKIGVGGTPQKTIRLNNLVLEELKKSNPRHYTEAQKVLAASDELCAPGAMEVWKVLRLPPAHCAGEFLRTSYPPKREVTFTIDDIRYIALVTVKDARPDFHPAVQENPRPVVGTPAR